MNIYNAYVCDTDGGNRDKKYFVNIDNAYSYIETMLDVGIVCEIDELETEDELDG